MNREQIADALYVYALLGRAANRAYKGIESKEYTKARSILKAQDPWGYIREALLERAGEPDGEKVVCERLRELRLQLDRHVTIRSVDGQDGRALRVVTGDKGASLLLSSRVAHTLAQITGLSQSSAIEQCFDRDSLVDIAQECGLEPQSNTTATQVLRMIVEDKEAVLTLAQSATGTYERLGEALKNEVVVSLEARLGRTRPVLEALVNEALNTVMEERPDRDEQQSRDFYANAELRSRVRSIEEAVMIEGMNAARKAHEALPLDRDISELRLRCELHLARNFRQAAAYLTQYSVPLSALGLEYTAGQEFGSQSQEGRIRCEERAGGVVEQLLHGRKANTVEVEMWRIAGSESHAVMGLKKVPKEWFPFLREDLDVEVARLPEGPSLGYRVLSHLVRPLGVSRAYVDGLRQVETQLAVALELVSFDPAWSEQSLRSAFESGKYETLLPVGGVKLDGLATPAEFFARLQAVDMS